MDQPHLLDVNVVSLGSVGAIFLGCVISGLVTFPLDMVLANIVVLPLATLVGSFVVARWHHRKRPFERELVYHARHQLLGLRTVAFLLVLPIGLGLATAFALRHYGDLGTARLLLISIMAAAGFRLETVLVMSNRS